MFLSPVEFADKTGENYEFIRELCRKGVLKNEVTTGKHIKIYSTELEKFLNKNKDFVSKEEYESVIRENERLRLFINQLKKFIENCD